METSPSMDYDNNDETPGTLPTELLEKILTEAWLSSMSPIERIIFIESVSRASKTWLATLTRIATRDIYFSSPSLCQDQRVIEDQSHFHWPSAPEIPLFQFCRSFTRQIPISQKENGAYNHLSRHERLRGKGFRELLSIFNALPYAPCLSTLSVEYFKASKQLETSLFSCFQLPVIRLEIEYTFSFNTPFWLVEELGLTGTTKRTKNKYAPWEPPNLHHISTSTADPTAPGNVLKLCPHLELAEEKFWIQMKVLSVSHNVHEHSAIVHGPLSSPLTSRCTGKEDHSANVVRGSALGLVLYTENKKRHWQDLTGTSRNINVFKERAAC